MLKTRSDCIFLSGSLEGHSGYNDAPQQMALDSYAAQRSYRVAPCPDDLGDVVIDRNRGLCFQLASLRVVGDGLGTLVRRHLDRQEFEFTRTAESRFCHKRNDAAASFDCLSGSHRPLNRHVASAVSHTS